MFSRYGCIFNNRHFDVHTFRSSKRFFLLQFLILVYFVCRYLQRLLFLLVLKKFIIFCRPKYSSTFILSIFLALRVFLAKIHFIKRHEIARTVSANIAEVRADRMDSTSNDALNFPPLLRFAGWKFCDFFLILVKLRKIM